MTQAAGEHVRDCEVPVPNSQMAALMRQVVLPAGNLEMMIAEHLNSDGGQLDVATRFLLTAAREGLHNIAQNGAVLASRAGR
ncbi:MAG: hypothetical protein AAFR17_12310 [Pseudomonadota bacterium]